MLAFFTLKYLHLIGATLLLGTGAGITFFLLMAHRTDDAATIAAIARIVVIADFTFTATAVVLQPLTGIVLADLDGYPLSEGWIVLSIALYLIVGACWLPVVWMQRRMRDLAIIAAARNERLPPRYYRLYRTWAVFGIPAFAAVLAIFWLMLSRPEIAWPGQG